MTKRILTTAVLALALAGGASAQAGTSPFSGVVVGTGHGVVFVSMSNGKLTALPGQARLGAHVTLKQGRLVVTRVHATPKAVSAKVSATNAVLRANDDQVAGGAKFEVEGTIAAVGTGTVTVNVGGQMVTVQLPAGISIPATFVGRAFELELRIAAPGVPVDNDNNDDHGNDANHGGHGGGDDGGGHGGSGRG